MPNDIDELSAVCDCNECLEDCNANEIGIGGIFV